MDTERLAYTIPAADPGTATVWVATPWNGAQQVAEIPFDQLANALIEIKPATIRIPLALEGE